MNSATVLVLALALVVSVQGGTRLVRQTGWSAPGPVNIAEVGASGAAGEGEALSEHSSAIGVSGSSDVPALLYLSTGSGGSLYQDASNYQSTNINADGSSYAYQGNSASNSGYANDNLWADAQGLNVNAQTAGWSAISGQGATGQNDFLSHQGRDQPQK